METEVTDPGNKMSRNPILQEMAPIRQKVGARDDKINSEWPQELSAIVILLIVDIENSPMQVISMACSTKDPSVKTTQFVNISSDHARGIAKPPDGLTESVYVCVTCLQWF